ncbi:YdcF family protein [Nocardia sp. NEAU-G5]|uniref:YdcF family protein n=1 Tax=Nocardia albiluteola TaxID=2842303 RepID=A0ABS6BDZ0_9NOCA|nr:ElyC/SanA/YdcF family protein [Nocardia albiluteola]MBU3067630.1 YdcF family protein [Nocardia albiluteola]
MGLRTAPAGAGTRTKSWLRPRRLLSIAAVAALAAVVVAGASIGWIRYRAHGLEYSTATVPSSDVALVLGAEIYPDGRPSPYVAARLDLGADLLRAGKVKALLLSGDYGHRDYDEPDAMRKYLVGKGVPADKLAVDYAGFDTYDSCSRAYRIFGVRRAIVVTQDFSVPRTVALCRSVGLETTAVGDHTQAHNLTYDKCWVRDQLAATKAIYSIVVQPDPILGRQETTVRDAMAANR